MRALECTEPGTLAVIDRPTPTPAPGEALVRVRRVGVCGTDLHIYEGSHPFLVYPRVIGHEVSGEIAEVNPGSSFRPGQQVYVIPYLACGRCAACRGGKTNCCQTIKVLGVHIDGGMAEYISAPESNIAAADGVSLDQAAMVEFLAIGAHAVGRANVKSGDRVLVVGAGPIGIGCALFARLHGGAITVLDKRRDRLDFCKSNIGAKHAVPADGEAGKALSSLTEGDFFDVVFEATGNARSMTNSLSYVGHGGTYVLVGVVRESISFEDPEFHKRETTLLASRNATPKDFNEVFIAMREGLVPTEALLTHRAKLEDSPARFPKWIRPETGVIKALIEI